MMKKRSVIISLLLGCVLIGSLLRFYRLYDFVWFERDQGRDVVVVNHITKYGEITNASPMASGTQWLRHSPLYFYFLSPLWAMTSSPLGLTAWFALLGVGVILIQYAIGSMLFNPTVGVIAAFLTSISYKMVSSSRVIWSAYFYPFFLGLTAVTLLLCLKTKNLIWWYASVLLFFVSLHLHLVVIFVLPVYFIWFIYSLLCCLGSNNKKMVHGFIAVVFFVCMALLWIYVTSFESPFDQFHRLINLNKSLYGAPSWPDVLRLGNLLQLMQGELFISSPHYVSKFLILSIVGFLAIQIIRSTNTKHRVALCFIQSFICSALLFAMYSGEITFWFILPTITWLFIAWGYGIDTLAHSFGKLGFVSAAIVACVLSYVLFQGNQRYFDYAIRDASYPLTREVIETIVNDRKSYNVIRDFDFNFFVVPYNYVLWDDTPFWYWIEKIYDKRLVQITTRSTAIGNNAAGILPLRNTFSTSYIVCLGFPEDVDTQEVCLEQSDRQYGDDMVLVATIAWPDAPKVAIYRTNSLASN